MTTTPSPSGTVRSTSCWSGDISFVPLVSVPGTDYGPVSEEFPARISSPWQIVTEAATRGRDAGAGPGTRGRGDVGADRGRARRTARPPDAVSRLPAGRPDRPRRRARAGLHRRGGQGPRAADRIGTVGRRGAPGRGLAHPYPAQSVRDGGCLARSRRLDRHDSGRRRRPAGRGGRRGRGGRARGSRLGHRAGQRSGTDLRSGRGRGGARLPDGGGRPLRPRGGGPRRPPAAGPDRKSTRLNSSHVEISYAV